MHEKLNMQKRVERLPSEIINILMTVGRHSRHLNCKAYLVGGSVRDILIDNRVKDLDITVVGDAIRLANVIWGDSRSIRVYPGFGTATVELHEGFRVDLATARKEFYPRPAVLPRVQFSDIYDDLYRRDFTINAMAMGLSPGDYGEILDYFGGLEDLKHGVLRLIHDKSFIDDPSRIFRCIRFQHRYRFRIDTRTKNLMIQSIKGGFPLLLSRERVAREINLLFSETGPRHSVEELVVLDLWELLFPGADISVTTYEKMERVSCNASGQPLYVALALLEDIDHAGLREMLAVYSKKALQLKKLRKREEGIGKFVRERVLDNYSLYTLFWGVDDEVLDYLKLVETSVCYKKNIQRYLTRVKRFPVYITGNHLNKMGIPPGQIYKYLLDNAKREIYNREIRDMNGQIQVLLKLVNKGGL